MADASPSVPDPPIAFDLDQLRLARSKWESASVAQTFVPDKARKCLGPADRIGIVIVRGDDLPFKRSVTDRNRVMPDAVFETEQAS
ncbi:MAG TPA: hypothetical protein VF649_03440 [Sphingomonas sp.]|jgi:hypothetical protein|uniref:hypothetical protein n=1 Tax=Sphingomonas sp. TaxID=28214 RepID=UPI002EDA255B